MLDKRLSSCPWRSLVGRYVSEPDAYRSIDLTAFQFYSFLEHVANRNCTHGSNDESP